jgi:hypothetical protein
MVSQNHAACAIWRKPMERQDVRVCWGMEGALRPASKLAFVYSPYLVGLCYD